MQKPTILVIDDEEIFLTLMHDLFTGEGYDVTTGSLAGGADALIAAAHPDVVMLDMRMETPDAGLVLLRALRADAVTADIPVLVCSADARFLQVHAAELHALGAGTLVKPFDLDDLLAAVAALIQARQQSSAGSEQ